MQLKMGFTSWFSMPKTLTINGKEKDYTVEYHNSIDYIPEWVLMGLVDVMKKHISAAYEKYGAEERGFVCVPINSRDEADTVLIYNDKYPIVEQDGRYIKLWAAKSKLVEKELIKFCNELFTYVDADTETYDPAKHHLYPRRRHPFVLSYSRDVGYEILFVKNL